MELFPNVSLRQFSRSVGLASPVTTASVKVRDTQRLDVKFNDGTALVDMGEDLTLVFIVKTGVAADDVTLALVNTWTKIANGHYRALLSLNTSEAIEEVGDSERIDAVAELSWSSDGGDTWESSATLRMTIENDVYKGDEDAPAPLPGSLTWLTAHAVRFDAEQELTVEQKGAALLNIGLLSDGGGGTVRFEMTEDGYLQMYLRNTTTNTWRLFHLTGDPNADAETWTADD